MRRRNIDVTARTTAPAEVVYGLLTDRSSWPQWSPIESVELEQPGPTEPEGVGSIRGANRRGRTTGRDQILELVPNRRFKYASLSGLPIRDYVGAVELDAILIGGTKIHWHSSFFPKTPGTGWLLERGLRKFLNQCVTGLADYAATSAASADVRRDVSSA